MVAVFSVGFIVLIAVWVWFGIVPWLRFLARFIGLVWNQRTRFNLAAEGGRWRLLAVIFGVLGGSMLLIGLSTVIPAGRRNMFGWIHGNVSANTTIVALFSVALAVAGAGFLYIGVQVAGYSKRLDARFTESLNDNRPPILYLRSFADDPRVARRVSIAGLTIISTEESELAEIVRGIGPLICVGRPGEALSYFGATRIYVADADDWRDNVRTLMSEARLVILRIGATTGLLWELEQAIRTVVPENLLLLISITRGQYEAFREKTKQLFPCGLPVYEGRWTPITTVRAVLYFDRDWTAHLVRTNLKPLWQDFMYKMICTVMGTVDTSGLFSTRSQLREVLEATLVPILQRGMN